jgi:hypothetical protein
MPIHLLPRVAEIKNARFKDRLRVCKNSPPANITNVSSASVAGASRSGSEPQPQTNALMNTRSSQDARKQIVCSHRTWVRGGTFFQRRVDL